MTNTQGSYGGTKAVEKLPQARGPMTLYPSFWQATHRGWNAFADQHAFEVMPTLNSQMLAHLKRLAVVPLCDGPDEGEYDPEQHPFCFELAQAIRIELHATGIRVEQKGSIE